MICIRYGCKGEVSLDRQRRRNVTCSPKCQRDHNINTRAKARAKRVKKEARLCDKCNMFFTDFKTIENVCYRCKKGEVRGPQDGVNTKYDPFATGNGGIMHNDFRATICNRKGKLCLDYSRCSDSCMIHKHGAFDYQINGGFDCYNTGKDVERVAYADRSAISITHINLVRSANFSSIGRSTNFSSRGEL